MVQRLSSALETTHRDCTVHQAAQILPLQTVSSSPAAKKVRKIRDFKTCQSPHGKFWRRQQLLTPLDRRGQYRQLETGNRKTIKPRKILEAVIFSLFARAAEELYQTECVAPNKTQAIFPVPNFIPKAYRLRTWDKERITQACVSLTGAVEINLKMCKTV